MQMQSQKQRDAFKALLETFTFQDDPEAEMIKALGEWCELKDNDDHRPCLADSVVAPMLADSADIVAGKIQEYIERDLEEEAAANMVDWKKEASL